MVWDKAAACNGSPKKDRKTVALGILTTRCRVTARLGHACQQIRVVFSSFFV
jgi:hypothetical protein